MQPMAKLVGQLPLMSLFTPKRKPSCVNRSFVVLSETLSTVSQLTHSTEGFQYLSRMLVAVAKMASPWCPLSKCSRAFGSVDRFVAGLRVILDAKYLIGPGFYNEIRKGQWQLVASNIAFAVADVGVSLNLANSFGFIDVASAAVSLGGASIFGIAPLRFMTSLALSSFVLYTSTLGFLILAAYCFRLSLAGADSGLVVAGLARSLAEIAAAVFQIAAGALITTTVGVVASGFLAFVAAGCAVTCVYHEQQNKRQNVA